MSLSSLVSVHLTAKMANDAFSAGLIHDADKLILARTNDLQAGEHTEDEGLEEGALEAIGLKQEVLAELGVNLVAAVEKTSQDVQAT